MTGWNPWPRIHIINRCITHQVCKIGENRLKNCKQHGQLHRAANGHTISVSSLYTVTWLLKAVMLEPEMFTARQRFGKHVPAATNMQATIEVLLGYNNGNGVFCWGKSRGYITRKTAMARASGTYKRQTRPLVREGAPRNQERNCQTYSVIRTAIKIWL
jgi:hypothetical protein